MVSSSSTSDLRRQISASLFGARYRLEVCGILHSGERVTASDLEARLNAAVPRSSLHVELQRLRDAGFLSPVVAPTGSRFVYFKVNESSLWDAARQLIAEFAEESNN